LTQKEARTKSRIFFLPEAQPNEAGIVLVAIAVAGKQLEEYFF